jgi:hypothetical protein
MEAVFDFTILMEKNFLENRNIDRTNLSPGQTPV